MGFTYTESYNIPIRMRMWFIDRCGTEIKKAHENDTSPHNAAHNQGPEERALQNRARQQVPARLRRST